MANVGMRVQDACIIRREKERVQRSFAELVICGIFLAMLSCRVVFRLGLLCLGLVEDDGVVDGGVLLPPRFLELVSARTGDCRVRRCAAAPPLAARLRLSPLRLSGWYCSVDRRTERTHAASHSRPVFDVFNGFPPPDPDVKL